MIAHAVIVNRRRMRSIGARSKQMLRGISALTSYVVDARPHALVDLGEDEVLSLTSYAKALRQAGVQPGEKVEAYGCANLLGENLGEWQAQMMAMAFAATRVQFPLIHIVISLPEHENWTERERLEAIQIIMRVLDLERCPIVWSEHSNTSNPHLHLAILRVDPLDNSAAGTDWIVDDLHQSVAIIEERQGRKSEPHALYRAERGAVYDSETGVLVRDVSGNFKADWYKSKSAKRTRVPEEIFVVRAQLIDAARMASSWQELHETFCDLNATYTLVRGGGRIKIGDSEAKASRVHATLSQPHLEQHLGDFAPFMGKSGDPLARESITFAITPETAEKKMGRGSEESQGRRLESVIRGLASYRYLPVRRRRLSGHSEQWIEEAVEYELILSSNSDGRLSDGARMDKHPTLQRFLGEKHARLIADVEQWLLRDPYLATELAIEDVRMSLRRLDDPHLAAFAPLVLGDPEFDEMLRRVRESAMRRERLTEKYAAAGQAQSNSSQDQPDAEPDVAYEAALLRMFKGSRDRT